MVLLANPVTEEGLVDFQHELGVVLGREMSEANAYTEYVHDLNNHLAIARGAAEYLLGEVDSAVIPEQRQEVSSMISDILSGLDRAKIRLRQKRCIPSLPKLPAPLYPIIDDFALQCARSMPSISLTVLPNVDDLSCLFDKEIVQKAIRTFMSNAADEAARLGHIDVSLEVSAYMAPSVFREPSDPKCQDKLALHYWDSGGGIAVKQLEQLRNASLSCVNSSKTEGQVPFGGKGVGLKGVARELAMCHAEISFENRPGQQSGAWIRILFPT